MTTALIARIEKSEAAARALLAEGFASKAAQGRARELASRAYSDAKSLIEGEGTYEVMCDVPYETNNYRTKHSTLIRTKLPKHSDAVTVIERTVALYQEIKAAPIVPKPTKAQIDRERTEALAQTINQALRDQFMAQAPKLAAEFDAYVRGVFAHYAAKFGDGESIPADLFPNRDWRVRLTDEQANQQAVVNQIVAPHGRAAGSPTRYTLDAAKLAAEAEKYGVAVAMQWFRKTNGKLGELADAALHEDRGGDVRVTGTKPDGAKVDMVQQRVIKWAPVARRAYHQFPARIYLNGQFTPFGDYAKTYGTADIAD